MTGKVVLELTREQAMTVERACELYARLKIGQFDRITENFLDFGLDVDEYCERRDTANDLLKVAASVIYGRSYYGRPELKDIEHKRAWEIYATLRHARSWHDNPNGDHMSCYYDEVRPESGDPLPKCEIKEG